MNRLQRNDRQKTLASEPMVVRLFLVLAMLGLTVFLIYLAFDPTLPVRHPGNRPFSARIVYWFSRYLWPFTIPAFAWVTWRLFQNLMHHHEEDQNEISGK